MEPSCAPRCDLMHFFTVRFFQAHLEIEVPKYYAGNDPLLTYATPLHPQEEHTTSRQELIGKVQEEQVENNEACLGEQSNSSTDSNNVKSWSLDHSYLSTATAEQPKKRGSQLSN